MRTTFDRRQVGDELLILELVERAIAVLAVGTRFVWQCGQGFDHLPGEILAQLVVHILDFREQDTFHSVGVFAAVKLMRSRLRSENAPVEIGRHHPIVRI